jgi:hypothetical protein
VRAGRRTARPPHQQRGNRRRRTRRRLPGTGQGPSGGGPRKGFLAETRRSNPGWGGCELQRPEDLPDHRALHDGGNDPQRPLLTARAARPSQGKDALEQSCPAPARRPRVRRLVLHPLLARRGEDGPAPAAVRRQTAPIAPQMDAWQGHEGGQLLSEFPRREPNPRGAIGPRGREGVDAIAVGVLRQALQGHGTAGGIPDEPLQLIPPMGGELGGGVPRKAMDAGTAGTGERGRFALGAKARANAPDPLASRSPKAIRCCTEAARVRASSGVSLRQGA